MTKSKFFFLLSLALFIISCGKDISKAIASNQSDNITAPWRISRETISSTSTDEEKDQLCKRELGDLYNAGNLDEAYVMIGYYNNTNRRIVPKVVVAMYEKVANSSTASGVVGVFCIRK